MQSYLVLKYLQFFTIDKDYIVLDVIDLKKSKHSDGMWSFSVIQKKLKSEHSEIKHNCFLDEKTYYGFLNWLCSFGAWVVLDSKNNVDCVCLSEESALEIKTENNEKVEDVDDKLNYVKVDIIL